MRQIDGSLPKDVVFQEIDNLLSEVKKNKVKLMKPGQSSETLKLLKFCTGF